MLITDYFEDLTGKIPYINYFEDLFCKFEEREEVKCTDYFYEKGFFKNLVWDKGAEYADKCRACPHFHHNIGFYFGKGMYSNDFEQKDTFYVNAKNTAELAEAAALMPKAKKLYLINGGNIDLSPIETLANIESVQLSLQSNYTLWDMSKTEKLSVLEIWLGSSPPPLDMLSRAKSVEYLNLQAYVSQTSNTVLPSFDFFGGMVNLKRLILSGVTNAERSIAPLISLPRIERLWISPNLFPTEEYAEFEAKKFKIFDEYGIFETDDFACPLGIGKRIFKSEKSREKFAKEYALLMRKHINLK